MPIVVCGSVGGRSKQNWIKVTNQGVWVLGTLAKLRKDTISFFMSPSAHVRPYGTTRLPLNGFSWNLIFELFRKPVLKIQVSLKIWQEWRVSYMKTNIHLPQYLTEFFLEWEIFYKKVIQEIETHIQCKIKSPPPENRDIIDIMWGEKIGTVTQATDENILWRMRTACWITKATKTLRICSAFCFPTAVMVVRK